jgi:hypothetical protein
MGMRKIVSLPGLLCGAVLLVGMLLTVGYFTRDVWRMPSPRAFHFQTINIDTQTMTAELSGPFPGWSPPQAQYYTTFRSQVDLGIDHYDGTKNMPYKVRYNAFSADFEKHLRGRSKLQELLSGPYGTVYAETKYVYGKTKGSFFEVMLYANKAEHEPAQIVDELPKPTPPLSAISLVRIFRAHPEYAVVTAVYDPQGKQQRASIFLSKGGDWFQDTDPLRQETLAAIKNHGLPKRFPIPEYLKRQELEWQNVGKANPENVINFHYDYNRWVRQDAYDAAGKRTTRYLTYVVTPEDKMLEAIDRELPFDTYKTQ